ncbi:MAG: pirin family protein [Bacteroidales bacterium]
MKKDAIINIKPLDFIWPIRNPFLFFAHHKDTYPAGNEKMGPAVSLKGRNIGQDFTLKDGWRMYHGDVVPGFPVHPHRGFETITIVLEGFVDHSDSHKQAGRYGEGDVQWMTAGSGLQHCEMFPLLNTEGENPAELFQIWLNLPKAKKFAEPHYKMLWSEDIPVYKTKDENGLSTIVKVIAGSIDNVKSLSPAPDSWAADPENEVAIWTIQIEEGGKWDIPIAAEGVNRTLYFYNGSTVFINEKEISSINAIDLEANEAVSIKNGNSKASMILLQGKPILEPILQYGPFVMNTEAEIQQAFDDYRKTEFGGWPWPSNSQVFARTKGRFALYKDGSEETR